MAVMVYLKHRKGDFQNQGGFLKLQTKPISQVMLDLLNLQWLNHNLQSKFSHEILDFDKILSLLYNRVLYANFDQFLAFYNENRGHTQILEKKVDFFLKLTLSTTVKQVQQFHAKCGFTQCGFLKIPSPYIVRNKDFDNFRSLIL